VKSDVPLCPKAKRMPLLTEGRKQSKGWSFQKTLQIISIRLCACVKG
jgi:hypothetical protein